jgi:hypothetical protein
MRGLVARAGASQRRIVAYHGQPGWVVTLRHFDLAALRCDSLLEVGAGADEADMSSILL